MAFLYLNIDFAGNTTLDQPLRIEAGLRDSTNSPIVTKRDTYFYCEVLLSNTQIWNPVGHSYYSDKSLYVPADKGAKEKEAAKRFYDFLSGTYELFNNVPVFWVGKGLFSKIHQIRAFFLRHGLNPYFNYNKNTNIIDSSYFLTRDSEIPLDAENVIKQDLVDIPNRVFSRFGFPQSSFHDHWLKYQIAKRIPFCGVVQPNPMESGSGYQSAYLPISNNTRGALLFDLGAWYNNKSGNQISDFLFWINYSCCRAIKANKEDDINKSLKTWASALKNDTKAYDFLKDGVSSDSYFHLVNEKNKGIDPELAIYGHSMDLGRLGDLFKAIYYNDTAGLENHTNKVFNLLYLRSIIKNHQWSDYTYEDSHSEEDLEIKDLLHKYIDYRYNVIPGQKEHSTGKAVMSMKEILEAAENSLSPGDLRSFNLVLEKSLAYKILGSVNEAVELGLDAAPA